MKTKLFKKMLAASAACLILTASLTEGTLKVWAEQYYGWNDGTSEQSPFFLYVTPTNENERKLETVVYCFNRDKEWPEAWEKVWENYAPTNLPDKLPEYEKKVGTDSIFKEAASNPRNVSSLTSTLVTVLSMGYPNDHSQIMSKYQLDNSSARIITQLAIWYFSDNLEQPEAVLSRSLTPNEKSALQELIEAGKNPAANQSNNTKTLDIYLTTTTQNRTHKLYQNLLGSTLITNVSEAPEKPQETTAETEEAIKPEVSDETSVDPNTPTTQLPDINQPNEETTEATLDEENVSETTQSTDPKIGGNSQTDTVPVIETEQEPQTEISEKTDSTTNSDITQKTQDNTDTQNQASENTQNIQTEVSEKTDSTTNSDITQKTQNNTDPQNQASENTQNIQTEISEKTDSTTSSDITQKTQVSTDAQNQTLQKSQNQQGDFTEQPSKSLALKPLKQTSRGSILPQTGEKKQLGMFIIAVISLLLATGLTLLKRKTSSK
ncbi:thioester-forming surface-anchored protein [Streptococcus halichoeri]|uniref:thioester-forming surface-anchored protein n=1 Tax=Streptococcus halichoeri TaxID=254785 RepID=UPI00135BBD36|nr:thioester-forming surface-anchored protein [Streptococcus halichoeri]